MTPLTCPLLIICLGLPAFPGTAAYGERADTSTTMDKNFHLSGTRLEFNTESGKGDDEISNSDVDDLRDILRAHPEITTLSLNSGGGSVWAAAEMARIAMDFELDTHVDGECSSSCVRILLAGEHRSMARGSKIGFHSRNWSASSIKTYYEKWHEDENWDTPFEFASWVYRDTYAEAYEDITWSISRGVDPAFAVEMLAPRDSMWFPTRNKLERAGILRDRPRRKLNAD